MVGRVTLGEVRGWKSMRQNELAPMTLRHLRVKRVNGPMGRVEQKRIEGPRAARPSRFLKIFVILGLFETFRG